MISAAVEHVIGYVREFTWLDGLEWTAFGLSAWSVWLYGRGVIAGGAAGLVTAVAFIAWGVLGGMPAAVAINIGFFGLHARNIAREARGVADA